MDTVIKVAEVSPSRGFAWLARGFDLFRRRPFAWIGLCTGWIVITFGLIVIPIVGPVFAYFLQPVFFASFAIAAYRQHTGEAVVMGDLFLGFRRNVRALVNLGALQLVADIGSLALMTVLGLQMRTASGNPPTLVEYAELLQGKEWILILGIGLALIVKGALWFAPPLIVFHDLSTTHAVRWSVYAALSNLGTMIVYAAVLQGLFILGLLPWGLGLLVVIPVMAISSYFGYREVFENESPPVPPAPPVPPVPPPP